MEVAKNAQSLSSLTRTSAHPYLLTKNIGHVSLTPLLNHIDLSTVILGGISEEEPAVIGITLFAVSEVGLTVWLRKLLLFLHLI